ncbi:MAG: T9SS type A sorting domain-containing protein, partial [Flavobacterium sp.]|nr:T9SS type A sorting domain-containing protein [Flavobacterium sp.]
LSLAPLSAQERPTSEYLGFYPNPVSEGKIFITSKTAMTKGITIFDVLGKEVLQTSLTSKELNVSSLSPGVYIIKIREGEITATRKLIIR